MKRIFRIAGFISLTVLVFSCLDDDEKNAIPPVVATKPISGILYTTALTGGTIEGDATAVIVGKGVCWDENPDPTIDNNITVNGSGFGEFESQITGLTPGKTYYVRAYAATNTETEYGQALSFTTHLTGIKFNADLIYGAVSDVDGNTYKTIPIGSQVWMAQNLKTTKFADGSGIPLVTDYPTWANSVTSGYCWFVNNDSMFADIYGAYYNWFAVNTGKLCPTGWHVPSDSEWQNLVTFLGGERSAGSKIKEVGSNNWVYSNKDATNQSGFTGIPAGLRGAIDGTFGGQGSFGGWWTTTEVNPSPLATAWCRSIHGDTTVVARNEFYKKNGFPVRCVKD